MGHFSSSDGGTLVAYGVGDRWTDLGNYTDSIRNVLARPGTFNDLFPETTDDGLISVLQDALAECHLEANLLNYDADDNGLVRPVMASGQIALVILYAGIRIMRAELLNRATSSKYVAGPVSAELSYSATILRDILKSLENQKDVITARLAVSSATASFFMADQYVANLWGYRGAAGLGRLEDWLPATPGWVNALA